jgi:hypothetical protein
MDIREFLEQVASEVNGDFTFAFKLLGFFVFISQEGSESLLTGNMISQRTYYRWMEIVQRAGWGDLLADARLRQVLREYLWKRFAGLPIDQARERVLRVVEDFIADTEAPSLRAKYRQESAAVKGERSETGGRESKTSVLDGGATGGSLGKAMAPNIS